MNDELKQLIKDAAKLLFGEVEDRGTTDKPIFVTPNGFFNPCDPERGDLMKVAMALHLNLRLDGGWLIGPDIDVGFPFEQGDYQSLALAILRAASAVLNSRGGV